MEFAIKKYGEFEGRQVDLITIKNSQGLELSVTNYGCIVTSLIVPDRHGHKADIVLGYKQFDQYLAGHPFFGAIAGRFANRIKEGRFNLDGNEYQLETNELVTGQHLHGGTRGFDKHVWGYDIEASEHAVMIHLHRVSPMVSPDTPAHWMLFTPSVWMKRISCITTFAPIPTDPPSSTWSITAITTWGR